jgi:endonuclease YncB( thermonuclease family)
VLCGALALIAALWAAPPDGAPSDHQGPRAVDGDTVIWADGRRVRLAGVDCPETGRPGAEAARLLAQAHLDAAGPALALVPPEPPRDAYDRLLADIHSGSRSLSTGLVEAGLAWRYRSSDQTLLTAQQEAVRQRRGIHAILDHPLTQGPYVETSTSFHHPACRLVRTRSRQLELRWGAAGSFASGRSPCRSCLAWPPRPPLGPWSRFRPEALSSGW